MKLERELIVELIASTESAAQRYFFFAERGTAKVPDVPDNLAPLRSAIERAVPHGSSPRHRGRDEGSWANPPDAVDQAWATLVDEFDALCEVHPRERPEPVR